jgi:hypothetical protein
MFINASIGVRFNAQNEIHQGCSQDEGLPSENRGTPQSGAEKGSGAQGSQGRQGLDQG